MCNHLSGLHIYIYKITHDVLVNSRPSIYAFRIFEPKVFLALRGIVSDSGELSCLCFMGASGRLLPGACRVGNPSDYDVNPKSMSP